LSSNVVARVCRKPQTTTANLNIIIIIASRLKSKFFFSFLYWKIKNNLITFSASTWANRYRRRIVVMIVITNIIVKLDYRRRHSMLAAIHKLNCNDNFLRFFCRNVLLSEKPTRAKPPNGKFAFFMFLFILSGPLLMMFTIFVCIETKSAQNSFLWIELHDKSS